MVCELPYRIHFGRNFQFEPEPRDLGEEYGTGEQDHGKQGALYGTDWETDERTGPGKLPVFGVFLCTCLTLPLRIPASLMSVHVYIFFLFLFLFSFLSYVYYLIF